MNKRRWIAVVIAAGLFICSGVFTLLTTRDTTEDTSSLQGLNALFYGSNTIAETPVVSGDAEQRIVRLTLEGTIANTSSGGLFTSETYDHQLFLEELRMIQQDPTISGILFEVNTPGGGVYESAEIARELAKIKEQGIPMYVSMKNMAASGGYYISAGADKIFATEETVTGSIGVIMSGINYAGLFEKLGIEDSTYKSGALKDAGSASREVTEADKEVLQTFVDNAYGRFVAIVAEGRGMTEEAVRQIADGRIYDGQQALEVGLVDEIGFPEDALAAMQQDLNLEHAEIFTYDVDNTGFAATWLGSKLAEFQGLQASNTDRILEVVESLGTSDAPKPLYYYGGE